MAEFFDLLNRFMTEVFNVKVFFGIAAAVIVFVLEIRFTRSLKLRNRRVEKSNSAGACCEGKKDQSLERR